MKENNNDLYMISEVCIPGFDSGDMTAVQICNKCRKTKKECKCK